MGYKPYVAGCEVVIWGEDDGHGADDGGEEQEAWERRERDQPRADTHDRGDADEEHECRSEHQLESQAGFTARPEGDVETQECPTAHCEISCDGHIRTQVRALEQNEVQRPEAEKQCEYANRKGESVHEILSKDGFRESHGGAAENHKNGRLLLQHLIISCFYNFVYTKKGLEKPQYCMFYL